MGKTPKPPKKTAPEPDASTPLYSAEQLADMGEAAFAIGIKVLQAMGDNGGVFVTREVDLVTNQAVYYFDSYEKYRLVKDPAPGTLAYAEEQARKNGEIE